MNEKNHIEEFINNNMLLCINTFNESMLVNTGTNLLNDKNAQIQINNSIWKASCEISEIDKGKYECKAIFNLISGNLDNANVAVRINFYNWSKENYVLMPAAAYNGNRFKVVKKNYPPMLHECDGIGVDMPITVPDVAHLKTRKEASYIHLRSGDMATPYVGVYFPHEKKSFQILAPHNTPYSYTGFKVYEAENEKSAYIQLEAPAVRQTRYLWMDSNAQSDDRGYDFTEGDKVTVDFRLYMNDCSDVPELYQKYCDVRKDISGNVKLHNQLPFSAAFRIIEDKYIKSQWNKEDQYLRVGTIGAGKNQDWQTGWVGGGMNSLAFLMDGNNTTKEYAYKTIDTVFDRLQAPTGFIYPKMHKGILYGDDFDNREAFNVLLLRKDADVLLFIARHIILLQKRNEKVPSNWINGFRELVDAFIRLWEKYGQFGQFVDIEIEEIIIGGTASAATAIGGLALASQILGDKKYLDTAIKGGNYYYKEYLLEGITNGGPGEILQAPDSESAFGLLESYIALYEVTGDAHWLPIAKVSANQCASWCVSYDFDFPKDTVFGQLNMNTTGSVYANVQNKHSAPGICTLSGVSLLKLYRATGDKFYLQLCKEISHNITQYLSRDDRPILSWDDRELPAGWMCERVNMSDWEQKDRIGGVFYGSCWCEVSTLLTYNEIPGVWILSDIGEVVVFDHILVTIEECENTWVVNLENPTKFDAQVKVYIESSHEFDKVWGECALEGCKVVSIPANGKIDLVVDKT